MLKINKIGLLNAFKKVHKTNKKRDSFPKQLSEHLNWKYYEYFRSVLKVYVDFTRSLNKRCMHNLREQIDYKQLRLWQEQGYNPEDFVHLLKKEGISEEDAQSIIQGFKKQRVEKKHSIGLMFCGSGGCVLLTSFLITFILFDTDHSFAFYLYGLTFIGIILVFKGMIDILGW